MIWILILNHLYLGDLILILKSSTYDDFAHLCIQHAYVRKSIRTVGIAYVLVITYMVSALK